MILSTPNNDNRKYAEQKDAFDLPPHHVGHFNRSACERIASCFGLFLVKVLIEPERVEAIKGDNRPSLYAKFLRFFHKLRLALKQAVHGNTGGKIIVVMKKVS